MKRALGFAVLLLLLPSCAEPPGSHESTISFNISEDPHSLNPLLAQSDDEQQLMRLSFDMLLDVDAKGRLIPMLAARVPTVQNGDVSRDGRRIVYHLRRGVTWQDGSPFTSRDVWATWRAIVDPRNLVASTRGYDLITSIATPDRFTAVVTLSRPWAPAVLTLFTNGPHPYPILPANLLSNSASLAALATHPIGTGPYRLIDWVRGDHLTYGANPHYFRGPPRTQRLIVREVPDVNTDLTMLQSGDLDWSLISPAERAGIEHDADIHFVFAPFSGFGALAFNCRRFPFEDVRLRRAVALSIDRAALSSDITRGQYPVTDSDQPVFSWAYDPMAVEPLFNPKAVDMLFDRLGWRLSKDGLRRKDGQLLSIVLVTFPEGDTAVRSAIYVQEMLRERGLDVTLKRVTLAQFYLPASEHGLLMSGNFDLAYIALRSGGDPDDSDLLTCRGTANYAGYCDAQIDALEMRALATPDTAARKALYAQIQRRIAAAVPYLFLYAPRYGYADRDVSGFAPTPYAATANAYLWVKN
ncbi:MAG TPA: peptide ABC transporter substrate-binding protein [Candidatus Eremiobacteraceae bacterium]|nr:peptide ABC transporter substrate-binding protein [Candidatus Eremiobacteraceae bacterium]